MFLFNLYSCLEGRKRGIRGEDDSFDVVLIITGESNFCSGWGKGGSSVVSSCVTSHCSILSSLLTPTAARRLFTLWLSVMMATAVYTGSFLMRRRGAVVMILFLAVVMNLKPTRKKTLLDINIQMSVHTRDEKL